MTKRATGKEQTHTGYTARHEKMLRRHARPAVAGFDPSENPVIIGSNGVSLTADPTDVSTGAADAVAINGRADGIGSVSIGLGQAYADYSIAICGAVTNSGADGSIAIGNAAQTSPSAINAIAMGNNAFGPYSESVGIGSHANPGKDYAVAIGYFSSVNKDSAVAIGKSVSVTGVSSVGIGKAATVAHDHSVALGPGATTTAINQVMLGTATDTVVMPGSVTLPGTVSGSALPTVNPGAGSGLLWNNAGTVKVA